MSNAVETQALRKHFGSKIKALKDFDLSVPQGCCFGLLGPNGAGKSTLIKTLLGISKPTSGSATLMGKSIFRSDARESVGYLPEGHRFPRYQTGRGVLKYFGKLAGLKGAELKKEIEEKLELVRLTERANDRLSKYSKGMNQRIGIAQAMLGNPKLVFLDEPTDGIDPIGRKEIRDMIVAACKNGSTIFINSHILAELEVMCDRVAIINRGELLLQGTVNEVRTSLRDDSAHVEADFKVSGLAEEKRAILEQRGASCKDEFEFSIDLAGQAEVDQLVDELRGWGTSIHEIKQVEDNLEDAFIKILHAHDQRLREGGN